MRTAIFILFLICSSLHATNFCQRNGFSVVPTYTSGSASLTGSTVNGRTGVSSINGITTTLEADTKSWVDGMGTNAFAGTLPTRSAFIAENLIVALRSKSYNSKVVWILPELGDNIVQAIQPLRDTLARGAASNTNLTNSEFSQSTGIQGNGSTQKIDSLYKPSEVGTGSNGGIGYWETNIAFDGTTVYLCSGCDNTAETNFYAIGIWSGISPGTFYWGLAANQTPSSVSAATNGHFYGERSGATSRKLYKNGSLQATSTVSDATSGSSENTIVFIGFHNGNGTYSCFHGRCAVAYLTNGTLGDTDAADFDQFLRDYLFTPTGRPTS